MQQAIRYCMLFMYYSKVIFYRIFFQLIAIYHYGNTPIQIYWKIYNPKKGNFQLKNANIFLISAQNIECWYSLEPPRRGGSNEYPQSMFWPRRGGSNKYPQSMFWAEIRKIMFTPVNPSFIIWESKLYRRVFVMLLYAYHKLQPANLLSWAYSSILIVMLCCVLII